jgi:hypothetical protein
VFRIVMAAALAAGMLVWSTEAHAQRVQAVPGQPFGVALVALPLPDEDALVSDANAFSVEAPEGRIFYPVFDMGRFAETAADFLGTDLPFDNRLRVLFLFTGDEPFEVVIRTPQPRRVRIAPELRRARQYDRMLARWWRTYNAQARTQMDQGDYPPLVENYLTEMLSSRLGLEKPRRSQRRDERESELQAAIQLLFGTESLRFATLRETMRGGGGLGETANRPLPEGINWQALPLPSIEDVEIEPIAMHVPEECFYIRFGSFRNYLWLEQLKEDYGGNIGQMITLRGHDAKLDERLQYQLALKRSAAAELFGPQIIADVALIGRDLYVREGAAMGILFQARNGAALTASFTQDRTEALRKERERGATLETVEIAGREVSFLSTPDNRLRSFYAIEGDYHLVTTSRAIVERFYEAADGDGSLGASDEFRHARWQMPLDQEETVFAYFSSAFFRGLLSPQYQIELSRRLRSVTNRELLLLAKLAARGEGPPRADGSELPLRSDREAGVEAPNEPREEQPHETLAELIAGGFLPKSFAHALDESGTQGASLAEQGLAGDRDESARFTPIPDVRIEQVTPSEAAFYAQRKQFCEANWPRMDPLMVSVKRYALDDEQRLERVVINANISPLEEKKYGWVLSMVGPPTEVAIQSNPDDVIFMQMSLQGGRLWPEVPPHHLFLGVRDAAGGSTVVPDGFFKTWRFLRKSPGFLGAWPELGLLDKVPFIPKQPDVNGFTQLPLGLWRWQGDGFSVLSYRQDVLADAAESLDAVPTENPAQIRLRVRDLSESQLAEWVQAMNDERARQTSLGNVRLLHTLTQQLRVPRAEALELAESLLETELVCTVGGEYQLREHEGLEMWVSTAWYGEDTLDEDKPAPLLTWFRGLSAELSKPGGEARFHAELDMQRKERESEVKLPRFNLFGGGNESR